MKTFVVDMAWGGGHSTASNPTRFEPDCSQIDAKQLAQLFTPEQKTHKQLSGHRAVHGSSQERCAMPHPLPSARFRWMRSAWRMARNLAFQPVYFCTSSLDAGISSL